jgi:hypothetical protein
MIVMMTVAVVEEVMAAMMIIAVMIAVNEDMAEIATTMLPVELTATPAMTAIAAVEVMIVLVVAEDTLIVMTEVIVAPVAMVHQQPPMAILPLVERLGSHTEVETTMMIDIPVVNIDR